MMKFWRGLGAVGILAITLSAAGCVNQPANTSNTNTGAATNTTASPVATPSPVAASNRDAGGAPVTLPVLDAFFADETFATELKSKLQLTDEQIGRLRSVAREETSKLRETEGDDHSGTTGAARARADEQIRGVIGAEKMEQLATLLRERWSGDGGGEGIPTAGTPGGATSSKMNAIPTDTRIVVNAPAYRMDVFKEGQLVKSYKIGIGYPEFPLPTGLRKATTIIFNPTWTPPDEPWVEGSNKVKVGQKVEAGSTLNPLGLIKIPIGLPSLIHGGKSPAKLGTFASHGCVGLTNPQVQDFAQLLAQIGGAELSREDVDKYAKTRTETVNVKLDNTVPVELRYETIVVEDGKLHIYRDVYDRGTNTEENLRAVLEAHGLSLDQLSEPERAQVMDALNKMARNASGQPTDAAASAANANNTNAPGNTNDNKNGNKNDNKNDNKNAAKNDNSGGRVTRTIKGQKEIVIQLAALAGKGYPAAVGIDGAQKKPQTASNAKTGKR